MFISKTKIPFLGLFQAEHLGCHLKLYFLPLQFLVFVFISINKCNSIYSFFGSSFSTFKIPTEILLSKIYSKKTQKTTTTKNTFAIFFCNFLLFLHWIYFRFSISISIHSIFNIFNITYVKYHIIILIIIKKKQKKENSQEIHQPVYCFVWFWKKLLSKLKLWLPFS